MKHLKRFGVGLLWGASITFITFAIVKFTIPVMVVCALIMMYATGMLLIK